MKKIIFSILILSLILFGCEISQPIEEQPVLYYRTIKVTVISNKKISYYTSIWRYQQTIKVKSKECNIEQDFTFENNGDFATMPYWNYKEGDTIQAELYSWKKESTGEIVRREINQLK